MNISIDFKDIQNFSKIFIDFIENKETLLSRFPGNRKPGTGELKQKAENFSKRNELAAIIKSSMSVCGFSPEQENNLDLLAENNSLAVVTGQQAGFLGGPLYTYFKAMAAIARAEKMNSETGGVNFIPVFWVEDNDHDLKESGTTNIFDREFNPAEVKLDYDSENGITAKQVIHSGELEKLGEIHEKFINGKFAEEVHSDLYNAYSENSSWTEAFIKLYSKWLGRYGILFVSASAARESGVFKELTRQELANPGKVPELVYKADSALDKNGYHLQAKASDINLFYHDERSRYRIDYEGGKYQIEGKQYSRDEILSLADKQPAGFSPKVLLRPVFQDYIIPTYSYISGPGEIAYLAQSSEIFDYFEVEMPAILPRMSATLIDMKSSRIFEKYDTTPGYFLKPRPEIEKELVERVKDKKTEEEFSKAKEKITEAISRLSDAITHIDPQLEKTASTAEKKCIEQIENLEKKTVSFRKRQNDLLFDKFRQGSDFIYPNGKMQERYYSPVNFIAVCGIEEFNRHLHENAHRLDDRHHFIQLF
jgi:bacillithiol biosynthesis cysteine-adding enzyme BshC